MALPTLLDIAIATGNEALTPLIDETSKAHPELTQVAAKPLKGRSYKTRVRVALGRITGSFRDANEGTAPIKHTYENREVQTYIINPIFQCDQAVADSHEDGAAAYIAGEREGILEGEMQGLASQFYYGTGTGGNAKGYPGLLAAYDATGMAVDAGGTTASTGSSCWLVRTAPADVRWRWGENGQMALTQPTLQFTVDPNDSAKLIPSYMSHLLAYPGVQVGSLRSICRIKKLTADSGKGLTDALIAEALSKFPVGFGPNLIFCSRRSAMQLQKSRTVTINAGPGSATPGAGVGIIAPLPDSAFNIPLHVTDAILETESLSL